VQDTETAKIIDQKTFWRAIGERAVGAAIVTARDENGPAGFLALSATHLSADPPMMMVSIDLRTSALQTVLNAKHFAINYLPQGSQSTIDIFGGKSPLKGADRFEEGRWTALTTGAPIFADASGALDCVLEEVIERHGAAIAIGRLVDFKSTPENEPLVSFRGSYR